MSSFNNLVSIKRRIDKENHNGIKPCANAKTNSTIKTKGKVYDSILDFVGDTPLVKLNKIPKDYGVLCDIYAKCEFLNPGGSIKDRISKSMIKDAKRVGVVNSKTEFVEATSGNTGIGIAFNAAIIGNKCMIITAQKNSCEKVNTMRLLGAEVIQVMNNAGEVSIARRIKDTNSNAVMLNQFDNDVNPKTHYETTGVEIVSALGQVDMAVMGAGTGGTITGVGQRLKEAYPKCVIVAAEPDGSTMVNKSGKAHPFLVEGIGGTWVPMVMDPSVVDHVEVVNDQESFLMARELARKEGLLCGGSSGAAMSAALKAIKALNIGEGKRVVVILPDGIQNYMTKFVNDQWMEAHLFKNPPEHTMHWWKKPMTDIELSSKYFKIHKSCTCEEALDNMKDANIAIVVNDSGRFVGAISKDSFRNFATNPTRLPGEKCEEFDFTGPVTDYLVKDVYTLAENGKNGMPTIGLLARILDITPFVVIGRKGHDDTGEFFVPKCIITGDDVMNYIYKNRHLSVCKE